jgi:phage baseplate assembly protein W
MIDINAASDASLGVDIECLDDISAKLVLVSGARNVALAIARRLRTPRGGLFYDRNYGFDLRQFCNADVTADTMREIRAGVEAEALKDERVQEARCVVTWEPTAERFRVELRCNGAAGPFRLVAAIGAVSVEFLRIEA